MRLNGKTALISGGNRGIGRAIALGMAREGADVAIAYAQREQEARAVVAEVASLGRVGMAVRADVTVPEKVNRLVEEVVGDLGRIDVLVNGAGMLTRSPVLDLPVEDFDRVLAVDLKGPFLLSQAVARQMVARKEGGCIINITSISAERAFPQLVHYQCAKAALAMLTKGMALELAPHRIRVNAIAPGLTATDMNRAHWHDQPEIWQQRAARIPLGRAGTPTDHAGAAVFLASAAADWITGATIMIDGGQTVS